MAPLAHLAPLARLALSFRLALCLTLMLTTALAPVVSSADEPLIRDLKVAYLYNFTRFIDWPADTLGEHFIIAVAADPAFEEALRSLERQRKRAQGRPIKVISLEQPGAGDHYQILVLGKAVLGQLDRILDGLGRRPVLTIGDAPGLAKRGVGINFVLREDILGEGQRLRFQVNPGALKERGLKVSAELYDVAEIVR
ncbi:MAG: hypothetical protein C1943_09630 [Halochromatium sp.]|nr:hypothetical protein [Halochromatium sp.]